MRVCAYPPESTPEGRKPTFSASFPSPPLSPQAKHLKPRTLTEKLAACWSAWNGQSAQYSPLPSGHLESGESPRSSRWMMS